MSSNSTNSSNSSVPDVSLVKHSASVWIYLAYSSLLLSYAFTNILLLRLFLILASVFFICFACIVGNVFLDSLIFNSVFILINIYQSIPLFMEYLEVKLDPLEEKIYKENFFKYLTRRKFKALISKSRLRFYSGESEITHKGNSFNCLYYIALVDPKYEVVLSIDGVTLYILKENSWVGIIEFMKYMQSDKKTIEENKYKIKSCAQVYGNVETKWEIDLRLKKCEKPNLAAESNEKRRILLEEYPAECWVYCFELVDLEYLFNSDDGFFIRNSMYSLWLYYTTKAVKQVDYQIALLEQEVRKEEVKEEDGKAINPAQFTPDDFDFKQFPLEMNPDNINNSKTIAHPKNETMNEDHKQTLQID